MAMLMRFGFMAAAMALLQWRQLAQSRLQTASMRQRCDARVDEISSLLGYLQSSTEEERTSLARGLHDELGGVLTSAKIDIAWLRKTSLPDDAEVAARIDRLSKAVDEAVNIERRVVETLRPSLLDHLGLGAALDWYVGEVCRSSRIACRRKSFDDTMAIPGDLAIVVYRVVQEALAHIVSNRRASEIEISLERGDDGLHLSLSDNGRPGSGTLDSRRQRQRLELMRQRALGFGGSFDYEQADGQGSRLRAFFPIQTLVETAA